MKLLTHEQSQGLPSPQLKLIIHQIKESRKGLQYGFFFSHYLGIEQNHPGKDLVRRQILRLTMYGAMVARRQNNEITFWKMLEE